MRKILDELDESKDLKRELDQVRRNVDDNLNYRKTKAEVDKLTREIETLEENMLTVGVISTIENELKKLSQERERLLSEVFSYP